MPMLHLKSDMIAEGDRNCVYRGPHGTVVVVSKPEVNPDRGSRNISPKAVWSNETSCRVFECLRAAHVPIAFKNQLDAVSFVAERCTMIPLAVKVRRRACGTYLQRYPNVRQGEYFETPVCEHFLRTDDRRYGEYLLPYEAPFIRFDTTAGLALAYRRDRDIQAQPQPFPEIPVSELIVPPHNPGHIIYRIERMARKAFYTLEEAWAMIGVYLIDLKVNFGFDHGGKLLLAGAIDNTSWRILLDPAERRRLNTEDKLLGRRASPERVAELSRRLAVV